MLTVSDRIQIPSKTTHKDTGTKVNKYSETSKRHLLSPPPRAIIPDARPLGTFENQDARY